MHIYGNQLELIRCPHCGVDTPNLIHKTQILTNSTTGEVVRLWRIYACVRCGGVVTVSTPKDSGEILEYFPETQKVDESIPVRPANYLSQALQSLHVPSGAIMLAASSIDAMLKNKGYKDKSLYSRIDKAAADNLITKEMAQWAHDIRLDANNERHADEGIEFPDEKDAKRVVDFTIALAEFLYVLPARVKRGIERDNV